MSLNKTLAYVTLLTVAVSCTTVKTDNKEKEIYTFFQRFKESLSKPDEEIFKHFETQQSGKAILAVIRILQNKSDKSIGCDASFTAPHLRENTAEIIVSIPVNISLIGIADEPTEQIFLPFYLKKNDSDEYVITRIEGEELYNIVSRLKNDNEWSIKEAEELEKRSAIYATAARLEAQYDSVIWYVTYNKQNYYYVVDSAWQNYFMHHKTSNERNKNVKMGLCDSTGALIIPVEYDLIGTIAFLKTDLVEVTKDNKIGYFDIMNRKLVINPAYDAVIPYEDGKSWIVKTGDLYGWIDEALNYSDSLPSDSVRNWVSEFNYLRRNVRLAEGNQAFCEIPDKKYAGNGIVIPPAYLVQNGLFDYIESGIVTSSVALNGWTEYKEGSSSVLEQINSDIQALIATVTERYLDGREEFYTKNKMIFFNASMDTLTVAEFDGDEISYRSIDSTLVEVVSPQGFWFGEMEVSEEYDIKARNYISLADGKVTRLESHRFFPETQFVKLDTAYLTGKFHVYDHALKQTIETTFLSEHTINWMRNDILAAYGYAFPGTADKEKFDDKWYTPRYNDIRDFEDQLTDIDRHNLAFLEKVLASMKSKIV